MRAVLTDLVHILFVPTFWVLCVLVALTILGYRRIGNPIWHAKRHLLAAGVVIAYLLSVPASSNALVNMIEDRYPVPTAQQLAALGHEPTIIVLAGGWFRATPDGYEIKLGPDGWERATAGIDLWRHIGGRLIFSGAPLPDHSDSNAEEMARLARKFGVPADRIAVETLSTNTRENLEFTQQKFNLSGADNIVLVTSAMHLPRAMAIAQHLKLPMLPYPCDFRGDQHQTWLLWVPGNEAASDLEDALHEVAGQFAYWIRGWS